ncbi:triose-phosphate isomerase [Candidatus Phytoplasma solani]|uniref:triose-phosphate isomerase n=1 Tax=Candidatus Phytoplasma solani TaxID=69896 RepID=UPI0003B7DBF8|nr:triose-phosphate isomerase [Candidatus Phytoplasma solani]CCP88267.1 Triosephosphate isomerase [Candidatus Phytoplasma solani]
MKHQQRIKVIACNWKMYKNKPEALNFIKKVNFFVPNPKEVETIIFAQSTLLDLLVQNQGNNLKIGAQNMFYEDEGAFTGEISPLNLRSFGINYVLLGHSERRSLFGETDQLVNLKLLKALQHNLTPILCLGETLETKENNKTQIFLEQQLTNTLKEVCSQALEKTIIAYEPVWAIGTGKTATPQDANFTIKQIRNKIATLYSPQTAEKVRILYGGSVSCDNVKSILEQSAIDGVLVGKAALQIENFLFFTQTATDLIPADAKKTYEKDNCLFCR